MVVWGDIERRWQIWCFGHETGRTWEQNGSRTTAVWVEERENVHVSVWQVLLNGGAIPWDGRLRNQSRFVGGIYQSDFGYISYKAGKSTKEAAECVAFTHTCFIGPPLEAGLLGWSSNSFLAGNEFHLGIGMYLLWARLENDDNNGYPKLVGPKINDLCTPWRRKWQPTPIFLPGKSHGRRILLGYSPWGRKESDTTGWLHFTSLQSKWSLY